MANLKDIKSRILSVQNTQKITRAMKMVAAAKVKKSETAVKASRPFSSELQVVFKKLLKTVGDYSSVNLKVKFPIENYPVLLQKREIKSVGILAITSNKGLAGAYNANVVRRTLKKIEEYKEKGITPVLYVVGQKGISSLKKKAEEAGFEIARKYLKVANAPDASGANIIAEDLAEDFVANKIDKIEIVTTRFKNMMSYTVEDWEVLPITEETHDESDLHKIDPVMIFEPNQHSILQKVVPLYITNTIFQSLLEAQASELASRMTAMSAASKSAEDVMKSLTIDYNKARQWAITQELLEVVSGADALKG